ncbi:MAG: redox-regulated ATPase YchF [Candidatus Aenigmarchaeota archaeon]|nr:redox-regulated ATPase YchF [Candidatus Aenigmarchaeota archaeon]
MIGLVGKPSSGKSSFFKALTMLDVKIASYPFTTIEPNRGVAYVKVECACNKLDKRCNPRNSQCINGVRLIPVKILDVAGLVPGAHLGRGKGNKFLDDLRQADALIHIVDMSGKTDENGLEIENHDPLSDIEWLKQEIEMWVHGIIEKVWGKKHEEDAIVKQLSGFSPRNEIIEDCINEAGNDIKKLSRLVVEKTKPMIIAANKMDLEEAKENFESISAKLKERIVPCSAEMEIMARLAETKGIIKIDQKTGNFSINKEVSKEQENALKKMQDFIAKYGSTGVQKCLDEAVFNLLNCIEVYPVENENSWADSKGNILPDVYLVPSGTTAKELASIVHTDLAKNFIAAIDARKKMKIKDDHILKKGDVIKIVAGK